MGRILFIFLVIFFVVVIASEAANQTVEKGGTQTDEPRMGRAARDLFQFAEKGFRSIAEMDRSIQNAIWELTAPELRCILGLLRCVEVALLIMGILSLRTVGKLMQPIASGFAGLQLKPLASLSAC